MKNGSVFKVLLGCLFWLMIMSSSDAACTAGQCTSGGNCYNDGWSGNLPTGSNCDLDGYCTAVNEKWVCVAGTLKMANGRSCSRVSDCFSGNCASGIGGSYCCGSGQCAYKGVCYNDAWSGNLLTGSNCDLDGYCTAVNENWVCSGGTFKKGNGRSCSARSPGECFSNNCISGLGGGTYCCNLKQCAYKGSCYDPAWTGGLPTGSSCDLDGYCSSYTQYWGCANGTFKKANGESCTKSSECYSSHCTSTICCNQDQCAGLDEHGHNACFAMGTTKDFGRYVCGGGGIWGIADENSCTSDDKCACGQCTFGTCCPAWTPSGAIYLRPEAPFFPGEGFFSVTLYANNKVYQQGSGNIVRDGDFVCCGANETISISTETSGEFFSIGGPTDSPPILFVPDLEATKREINAGTFRPATYELTVCDYRKRCLDHRFANGSTEYCVAPDSCRCVNAVAVLCASSCRTDITEGRDLVNVLDGGGSGSSNNMRFEVLDQGELSLKTRCNLDCITYWEWDSYFRACDWYRPQRGFATIAGTGSNNFIFNRTIDMIFTSENDSRRPDIVVQDSSVTVTNSSAVIWIKLINVGDFDGTLYKNDLNISSSGYTSNRRYDSSNVVLSPGETDEVLFTVRDVYQNPSVIASFAYSYNKGGDCSGKRSSLVSLKADLLNLCHEIKLDLTAPADVMDPMDQFVPLVWKIKNNGEANLSMTLVKDCGEFVCRFTDYNETESILLPINQTYNASMTVEWSVKVFQEKVGLNVTARNGENPTCTDRLSSYSPAIIYVPHMF